MGRLTPRPACTSASLFPLRGRTVGPRCPERGCRAIARAVGCPPARRVPPGRVRSSGEPRARGMRWRTWSLGSYSCRLPCPGRPSEWVQPAVSSLPTSEESGWVVRVGLLTPKATEGLFELDARFRSRPVQPQGWRWSRRASRASESIQRPVPVQPQVPKPPQCASTPPRLIVNILIGQISN